jgi:hypothetical protein
MKWHRAMFVCWLLPISPVHAQGGSQSYPYCAQYNDSSSQVDCSFSTLSMCYQSVTGVGGFCIGNPRRRTSAPARNSEFAFGPVPVPPPPSQSQGPLQLPGPPPQARPAESTADARPATPPCNPVIDGTYCATAASSASAPIHSFSSDLFGDSDPPGAIDFAGGGIQPATLGAINFSGSGASCIGLFRQRSC